ncbi:hypothetical protein CAPTEDRAFT_202062 [Capitella teleta]|uniref:Neurotransmitter-gated ion-channel ligand-binding domain-containing protein n=1 Tax=Capitella teleta TaxID=283909 RepID=R7T5W6_CAPTE|nr:hypothetical protein CAPTEDRAFT_202062 [Capitella teleta]|eukprot:ELT88715.1 hypothetical protein CAPTEDRAFT_202062 [Capitella teleta]
MCEYYIPKRERPYSTQFICTSTEMVQSLSDDYTDVATHLNSATPGVAKTVPPVTRNATGIPSPVTVHFGLALIQIDDFEPNDKAYTDALHLDERLQWDPSEYNRVVVSRIPSSWIWNPDLVMMYNIEYSKDKQLSLVYNTGDVLNIDPIKRKTRCFRQNDGQYKCKFDVVSWTYDGNVIDLQPYEGLNRVDLSDYVELPGVSVTETTAQRVVKYYPCCPEPYVSLDYTITLKPGV